MSTILAAPPPSSSSSSTSSAIPHAIDRHISPRQFATVAPATSTASAPPPGEPASKRQRSNDSPEYPGEAQKSNGKISPGSLRSGIPPAIKVKKEPGSPALLSSRPRPKRLDLSSSMSHSRGPQTARPSAPLTSRESAGLAIQDVGLACLSPGFQTNDPSMQQQLQRSLDVREQQRSIIEARQKGLKPGSSHDHEGPRTQDNTLFGVPVGARTPTTSRRKGPPPGLSINAPSASQFASDRVIQSAPLHQTFTGLRPGEYPHSRHVQHGPSGLSQTSHIHHIPATQTTNRLPPIADVFANDRLDAHRHPNSSPRASHVPPPVPSPGFPPPQFHAPQHSLRGPEFRSSEEAIQGMSGGREDMLPKVVHYGGVQPPTPPSPIPQAHPAHPPTGLSRRQEPHHAQDSPAEQQRPDTLGRSASMNGRRRGRDEYERDQGSPPSMFYRGGGGGGAEHKRPAMLAVRGDDRDREEEWRSDMSGTEKKEEFMRLMEKAWDLFHS